ncbi:P-II family nitrogen regulator [Belliella kenyensis]|uniref:P-II family nitrogen regulator n=1 Tax=Belliella kenyensis TaxID=1472724 RepID=A0ABV8EI02_9BACT|nr:P-II family nitrogen regulator [Belliella kenyensis]MCH7401394.1 P-II family nitrogen regulator [Belliella kenyensis]MDN3602837.1 P-II family nitrogen regulator [Belliella kenyensis]
MKKIEAIIRTSKFEDIYKCVAGLGIKFLSFYDVKGMGLEHAKPQTYRGVAYEPSYIPRTKIEIVTTEDLVEAVVNCILKEGKTGEIGDGKIFISDIQEAYRIRNNDTGASAL